MATEDVEASETEVSVATSLELEELRTENADLRQRVAAAEAAIGELRAEALARRQEVRALVADLPVAMSRKTLLRQVASDVVHHPDKKGVVVRIVNKIRRKLRPTNRR
jgi:hypothetical protein